MCTALVVGNMIGSGVFLLPASLAPYGTISMVGWVVTATGAVLLALVFARLARLRPAAGGPYAYTRESFGDFAGFMIAWGFPAIFGRLSAKGVPTSGLVISGILSSLLLMASYTRGLVGMFTFIILLATVNTVVPYAFCSLAHFLAPPRDGEGPRRGPRGHSLVAGLAFAYAIWAIMGAGRDAVYWGSLLLLAGIPVFVWLTRRSSPEFDDAHS